MTDTIFDVKSLDRSKVQWEDYLYKQTPVEQHGGIWYKREDKFAPLGYGSINGSKLRQCIWLVNGWVKDKNVRGVVSGSVVGSPQHPFIASSCKHYKIGCLIATGSKNHQSHLNMQMAEQLGASFHVVNIGYAKALQSKSFQLADRLENHEVLETNITVDEKLNPPSRIEAFHRIGAEQVKNIPDHIETIIIPCGSCNSVVSILYGIAIYKPKSLKRVLLMGIGNNGSNNLSYIPKRLKIIGSVKGKNYVDDFKFDGKNGKYDIMHHNLNGSGYCTYSDTMPFKTKDIEFHPRYEGKCMNFIYEHKDRFSDYWNEKTLFWIVGSEPKWV
jgi:hypothetical protein